MPTIDPDIKWFYDKGLEAERLATLFQLEEARTRRIVSRRLPEGTLRIADIGGGPGAYACWLAAMGHAVDLVDPVPLHLEQARAAAAEVGVALNGVHEGVAESLPFDNESFDAVLLMGPLYHLPERGARLAALREAHRVLRPGGLLFAAVISRYASTIDGFFRRFIEKPEFVELMKGALRDGRHLNPTRHDDLFTTSYFHTVGELEGELNDASFSDIELLPIEGVWPAMPGFEQRWQTDQFRELLLDVLDTMETDPSITGFGGHIMGVGRRAG